MELILSVIVANVYPGSMTGAGWFATLTSSRSSGISLPALRLRLAFSVGVGNLSQVGGAGSCIQVGQQPIVTVKRFEFRHPAVWIVDVAEDVRVGRTGLLASSLQRAVFDFELAILADRRGFR